MRILILHGPSLGHLGKREPHIYGSQTLHDVNTYIEQQAIHKNIIVEIRQSNHEGVLVDWILDAAQHFDGLILNAAAYTHTSVALHDAVKSIAPLPVVEVHLSNTAAREPFRQHSYVGAACIGRIEGFGAHSYVLALESLRLRLPINS